MAIWAEIKKAINSDLDTPLNTKMDNLIGATGNTGGSTSAGTVMGKLNALLTSWTSTRAGYVDRLANSTYGLDKIKTDTGNAVTNTATNNTASKTGVLSAKLAYVIGLLENSTYGLNAIKTILSNFVNKNHTVTKGEMAKSGQMSATGKGTIYLKSTSSSYVPTAVVDGVTLDVGYASTFYNGQAWVIPFTNSISITGSDSTGYRYVLYLEN